MQSRNCWIVWVQCWMLCLVISDVQDRALAFSVHGWNQCLSMACSVPRKQRHWEADMEALLASMIHLSVRLVIGQYIQSSQY